MNEEEFLSNLKAKFLEEFEKKVEILRQRLNISLEELGDLYLTWVELQNALPKNHEFSFEEVFEMLLVKHNKKCLEQRKRKYENEADSPSS